MAVSEKSAEGVTSTTPEIGDERLVGRSRCRWVACAICGAERWVRLVNGIPRSATCYRHDSPETKEKKRQRLLGRACTQETRSKISAATMGRKNWLGKKHSEETKHKLSVAHLGKSISLETREKLRQINQGRRICPETRLKISAALCGRKLTTTQREALLKSNRERVLTDATREKMRLSQLGKEVSEKTRSAMRKRSLLLWRDPEYREKILAVLHSPTARAKVATTRTGHAVSDTTRSRIQAALLGHGVSPTTREKIGDIQKNFWSNPEYKAKVVKAMRQGLRIKPNKPESVILSILDELRPRDWKFVGDGSFIIAGKNPDFVNVNGKKQIIEMFGDYWHRGQDPQERISLFADFGYNTLVVWERELKNSSALHYRIKEFID